MKRVVSSSAVVVDLKLALWSDLNCQLSLSHSPSPALSVLRPVEITANHRKSPTSQPRTKSSSNHAVTPSQIERLYSRFTSLDKGDNGTLKKEDFLRIPELAINPLGERIVQSFFDEANDERINFRQFMKVLARFRPAKKSDDSRLNSKLDKLRYAFNIYDLDSDDKITKDELLAILHMMVGANISDEQLANIADRTIMEADQDGDQCISFKEFCNILERTDVEDKLSIRFLH